LFIYNNLTLLNQVL